MLGKFFEGIKNKANYNKPHNYSVNYRVIVKNLSEKQNNISVILPFPLQTLYQKVLGQVRITPKTGGIKKENKLQNKYIHWEEKLKQNTEKVFELNFKVLVKARIRKFKSPNRSYVQFLKSDQFIDVNKKIVMMSKDLVGDIADREKRVKILNNFVVNNLEYGNPIEGLYSSNDALTKDKVDCGGFDTLLAALCIAQKIPARIVSGFFAGFGPNQMHAWLEINLDNQGWIVADPSIEKLSREGRSKKFAKLGFIGSDRVALALGHNFKIKLGKKIINLPILQNPVVLADGKIGYNYTFETRTIK